jgi:hypothetical protein
MQEQMNAVKAALSRLDQDMELIARIPAANTQAARAAADAAVYTAHERCVEAIREAVGAATPEREPRDPEAATS